MATPSKAIIDLEKKFWQSIVDTDTDAALELLCEPAVMVSAQKVVFPNETTAVLTYHATQTMGPRGKSDGETRQEVNDTSTWIKVGDDWKCVMHTETPASGDRQMQ